MNSKSAYLEEWRVEGAHEDLDGRVGHRPERHKDALSTGGQKGARQADDAIGVSDAVVVARVHRTDDDQARRKTQVQYIGRR